MSFKSAPEDLVPPTQSVSPNRPLMTKSVPNKKVESRPPRGPLNAPPKSDRLLPLSQMTWIATTEGGCETPGVKLLQSPVAAVSGTAGGGVAAGRGAKGVRLSVPCIAVFRRSRPRDRWERTAPTEVPIFSAASA
jgi:hypothetical protein